MTDISAEKKRPKIFISYSWDSQEHQEWVLDIATKLSTDEIEVTIDHWDLAPGDHVTEFMEQSIRTNDYVLIICTPPYKKKSDGRIGGVGYEGHIITAELNTIHNQRKFIPILRHENWKDAAPTWLLGKRYVNLTSQSFDREYKNLVDTLHGRRQTSLTRKKSTSLPSESFSKNASASQLYPYRQVNNWGYSDQQQKIVVPIKYDKTFPFCEDLGLVERNKRWGFVSKTGEEAISLQYEDARSFSEGFAAVKLKNRWGFIDKTGEIIIPPTYRMVGDFSEGRAEVWGTHEWGFIDGNNQVLGGHYRKVRPFSEGLSYVSWHVVCMGGGYFESAFIDQTGKITISKLNSWDVGSFSEGLAYVQKTKFLSGSSYGFINKKGEWIIDPQYVQARNFSNNLAPVKVDNKWGFIDHSKEKVIRFKYDDAFSFSEELAAVKLDKWGFINLNGEEVISLDYDEVGSFFGGVAKIRLNGKHGYLGRDGTRYFDF